MGGVQTRPPGTPLVAPLEYVGILFQKELLRLVILLGRYLKLNVYLNIFIYCVF